jgi:hypothetical protein
MRISLYEHASYFGEAKSNEDEDSWRQFAVAKTPRTTFDFDKAPPNEGLDS